MVWNKLFKSIQVLIALTAHFKSFEFVVYSCPLLQSDSKRLSGWRVTTFCSKLIKKRKKVKFGNWKKGLLTILRFILTVALIGNFLFCFLYNLDITIYIIKRSFDFLHVIWCLRPFIRLYILNCVHCNVFLLWVHTTLLTFKVLFIFFVDILYKEKKRSGRNNLCWKRILWTIS